MSKDKDDKKKAPKRGVGTAAAEAILAGKNNEEALAVVLKEFPEAKTSLASINWYRNNLRSEGKTVPTARDLKKKVDKGKGKGKSKKDKDPLD